jgi:hypothetical protein
MKILLGLLLQVAIFLPLSDAKAACGFAQVHCMVQGELVCVDAWACDAHQGKLNIENLIADSSLWGYAVDKYAGNVTCTTYPDDSLARADAQNQANYTCDSINEKFSAYETEESKARPSIHSTQTTEAGFGTREGTACITEVNFSYTCH